MKQSYAWGLGRRTRRAAVLGCATILLAASAAHAATGDLAQKAPPAGCVSDTGSGGECQSGLALDGAEAVAVSPDGTSVYVAAQNIGGVAIFDRDPATGTLTQKAGTAGCVTGGGGACQLGKALNLASGIAVSPDGKSVYVAASASDAVAIFDRDLLTGALTQKADTAGCVSEDGTSGTCQNGAGLDASVDVAVSPDGASVYVVSQGSNALAIFDRTASGALTQKPSTLGCISETGSPCHDGVALDAPSGVAVSPNGAGVYVSSFFSDAVAVFDRNTLTGALTQKEDTAACVSDDGTGGTCQDGVGLNGADDVAVSPDGASVYAATRFGDAAVIFDRNATNGELTQKAGTAGCVSEDGLGPCQDGAGLNGANGIAVTADGASVYVSSGSTGAVSILDRNTATGGLTPKPGTAGCVSDTGSGGACQNGIALEALRDVAVSADGTSVYTASLNNDAIAIFDREPIQISIDDVSVPEGDAGPTAASFTISLSIASEQQITVDFETSDGTATAPGDYTATSGTATFAPGDTAEPASVQVNGDLLAEADETFNVDLSDAENATIADALGVGTIIDDALNPPETTITKKPRNTTEKTTARFKFVASELGSTFRCKLDRKPYRPCASPFRKRRLDPGKHKFRVLAIDAEGNPDRTPANDRWKIEK